MKKITSLFLVLVCAACVSPAGTNTDQKDDSIAEQEVSSKLNRIEKAFERGENKTACNLHISLSKELTKYNQFSPEILKKLKKIKLKCGASAFILDF